VRWCGGGRRKIWLLWWSVGKMIAYIPWFVLLLDLAVAKQEMELWGWSFARCTFFLPCSGDHHNLPLLIHTVLECLPFFDHRSVPLGNSCCFSVTVSLSRLDLKDSCRTYRTAANPQSSHTIHQVNILPTLSPSPPNQAPSPTPPFAAKIPVREARSYLHTHHPAQVTKGIMPSPTIPLNKTFPCCSTFFRTCE
jgi:hypothetical protein